MERDESSTALARRARVAFPERVRVSTKAALGCVAYWLLSGETVFQARSVVAMALAHVREDPQPVSLCAEFGIPPALDDLILACLDKDRARRPASARAVTEAILALQSAHPWTQAQAEQWWHAHRPQAPPAAPSGVQ